VGAARRHSAMLCMSVSRGMSVSPGCAHPRQEGVQPCGCHGARDQLDGACLAL